VTRVSPRILIQKVDDEIVIIDQGSQEEVLLNRDEALRVAQMIMYFFGVQSIKFEGADGQPPAQIEMSWAE